MNRKEMTMAKAKKTRPRKQTSPRVSTLAAYWLDQCKGLRPHYWTAITARELKVLCASLLSQDEIRGQAKPKAKGRKRVGR